MGGPTAMLLLKNKMKGEDIERIKEVLKEISVEMIKDEIWDWEFWVSDTNLISGKYKGEGRPFGFVIQDVHLGLTECKILEKEFGFQPTQEIQFDAMCNSKDDHRIMGELLLYLAQKYDSIIDFNGAILPPAASQTRFWLSSWNEFSDEFNLWVKDIPGKIYGLEYFTADEDLLVSHKSDVVFLQFWLDHPSFHMIK